MIDSLQDWKRKKRMVFLTLRITSASSWTFLALVALLLVTPSPAAIRKAERDHCNKTVDIYEDVSSPAVTSGTWGKPLTCWYRFRAFRGTPRDWILRVRFKKFKVGVLANATHCLGGFLQIIDGNTKTSVSNRKEPGVFCGESEQPQTFISETSFVRVLFHADNFTDQTYFSFDSRAEQQFEVYLRYGQHPELYPNRRGVVVPGSYCERDFKDCRLQTCYVQSPAYPGIYPRALHCKYKLNTRQPFIKLYIENEEFNIDGQRCENIMTCPMRPISSGSQHCPFDYIRVYDGINETAPVIGTFCGMGKFPYSIIGTSADLYVEFVSSPAGPLLNTGFHFNVGNWPAHVETAGVKNGSCDWLLSSDNLLNGGEGIFLSVAHWYPPHTSCTYLLRGRPGEIARLYFPSFRVNRIESPIQPYDGDCGESLTLYDANWPDDARIIKTFCDTFSKPMEKHDFVSTSNAMFVRFESKTGSYSGSSLYYWAHYDFFNASRFGEPLPNTECDEIFTSWKAHSGQLRSPLNSLLYKRSGDPPNDLSCTYTFITDKRLFARVILTVESVTFKDNPYAQCNHCWDSHADKVIVREPNIEADKGHCICKLSSPTPPLKVVSRGEKLELKFFVDGSHAAPSYFKQSSALFKANYEFVHSPLCGAALLPPATDGEIEFPSYEALSYVSPPRSIKCIWELRVNPDKDLWLHFDKIKFASRSCEDGKLEIFLASITEPYLAICGENVSNVREMPIFSAVQLGQPRIPDGEPPPVVIQFTGSMAPARVAFKIAWTELFRLPRDTSGQLNTQKLQECGFQCPRNTGCIPERLLCNGIVNCPNINFPSVGLNISLVEPNDESDEICGGPISNNNNSVVGPAGWAGAVFGASLAVILSLTCLIVVCRFCRRRSRSRNIHVPY
ncbi:cubilin homolog isoform X1 [Cotesia typhae]|uniref:cubilin homolog isoform X1 n=1 Tax=Cotesia typhae TaxID=2053667 RepID=UPI003D69434C